MKQQSIMTQRLRTKRHTLNSIKYSTNDRSRALTTQERLELQSQSSNGLNKEEQEKLQSKAMKTLVDPGFYNRQMVNMLNREKLSKLGSTKRNS
jgi:hypothetical protein